MRPRPLLPALALASVVAVPVGCDEEAKKEPEATKQDAKPTKGEAEEKKAEEPVPDPKALAKPAKKVEAEGEILE
jgi:hypothetical protein